MSFSSPYLRLNIEYLPLLVGKSDAAVAKLDADALIELAALVEVNVAN